jgi:hypothetical protein
MTARAAVERPEWQTPLSRGEVDAVLVIGDNYNIDWRRTG